MQIVEASAADLEDALLVERLAFGSEEEAGLVRDLLNDPSARPLLSLLAREHGRAVGHVLFTAATIEDAAAEVTTSILAPLAVIPDRQRAGIGGQLIEHGVERLADRGVGLVFVLGHPSYYPRHGFEPATPRGLLAPYPVDPEEAWMVRALRSGLLERTKGRVICAVAMDRPEYWRE